jgi:predicted small lipoprotein YifL
MKRVLIVLLAFAIITVFAALAPAGQKGNSKLPVRVFISVDMEGI